ncbi:MAG: HD domain-containing protein [Flavobacteriales bacterium]|nr:MAG: HD domain-containing protein [Flavobacteriales bacterium]
MNSQNKLKIINDPIYGFITIPSPIIFELIEHKYFQRLRRISQMGMSYMVYPGAHHTRFQHAIGAMHLMQKAVQTLMFKGVKISAEESEALYIAILLHDIGHGPFSHAMEHSIVEGIDHESISLLFMSELNKEFNNRLTLAIQIFSNNYHRNFFYQLISGQLDMDRLDYLKRDSFYTGVSEGSINSERLISMLNVVNDRLVVEEKGIYSVEKFIVARRLMYWQVYLHKTSLVAEQLLTRLLKRAKHLVTNGIVVKASEPLRFFLNYAITKKAINGEILNEFAKLDDNDIIAAMKSWRNEDDFVLSNISKMLLDRELLKIEIQIEEFDVEYLNKSKHELMTRYSITEEEASYFVFKGQITNQAYSMEKETINLYTKQNKTIDVANASDHFNLKALSKKVVKNYMCYPKTNK